MATARARELLAAGTRTVRQAVAETGLSRQELFALMAEGVVEWFAHGGRGTRLIVWSSLVDYLAGEYEAAKQK
jgi:hypothetical protein